MTTPSEGLGAGPRCAQCVRNYPDEAEHESCAEIQIAAESVPLTARGPLTARDLETLIGKVRDTPYRPEPHYTHPRTGWCFTCGAFHEQVSP